ncbi:MAG: MerR family DNA-binding protein [Gammaproteobacteria bacterium]|nr:MerR family DNA-binding protein [Gammaproteobacteria bacterium]
MFLSCGCTARIPVDVLSTGSKAPNRVSDFAHTDPSAAKSRGLTLSEIRDIFSDADRGDSPCPRVRTLIEQHIVETEQRLAELGALHEKMRQALRTWRTIEDQQPTSESVCALIEALDGRE